MGGSDGGYWESERSTDGVEGGKRSEYEHMARQCKLMKVRTSEETKKKKSIRMLCGGDYLSDIERASKNVEGECVVTFQSASL